jgi:hypothetical protein
MIAPARGIQQIGAISARGLDDDDFAHWLGAPVRLGNEDIDEGPQEIPGTELKNGFFMGCYG